MEKAGRDNHANMSPHGKLTVQKNAKVANTVEWFHLNATYLYCLFIRWKLLQKMSRTETRLSSFNQDSVGAFEPCTIPE